MKKLYSLIKACMSSDMSLFKIKTNKKSKLSKIGLPLLFSFFLMFTIWVYANALFEQFTPFHLQFIVISLVVFFTSIMTIVEGIYKIPRIIIKKHAGYNDGIFIYIEPIIEYGYNINETMLTLKRLIKKEIEKLTAMNVLNMEIVVKGVHYEKK